MCLGENCAPQAVQYLNAQLSALHDNAVSCLRDHASGTRTETQFRLSHALAHFSYRKYDNQDEENQEDIMFDADFGTPCLEFICNHDAFLRLKIEHGEFNVDHSSQTTPTFITIRDTEVVFRVSFVRTLISGQDTKIGSGRNFISLVVLDLNSAHVISVKPSVPDGNDALVFYLSQYLTFLRAAGNHVLFSLPEFDSHRPQLSINFSLMQAIELNLDGIHGISLKDINNHLMSMWLKAAMLASEGTTTDWRTTCLAELSSFFILPEDSEMHFGIIFGAPRIRAICPQEGVVFFAIDEVAFYSGTNDEAEPIAQYKGWTIALLVDIVYEKLSDGDVVCCKLDAQSARVYDKFCSFGASDEDSIGEEELSHRAILVDFIKEEYLGILESANYHVIYHLDQRINRQLSVSTWATAGDGAVSSEVTTWKDIVSTSSMGGFDEVIALSQAAVNEHYSNLCQISGKPSPGPILPLVSWAFQNSFWAMFKPLTIRFLSNEKAIIWIHLDEGSKLRTLDQADDQDHDIGGWRLAFEVDLKMCAHAELQDVSEKWRSRFESSQVFKHHSCHCDRTFNHLYLSFERADFIHEYSTLKGLFQEGSSKPIEKLKAAMHYIKSLYFKALTEDGLNILYTIPVWKSGSSPPPYALTSVSFHVYGQEVITRQNWSHATFAQEPVIVLLGMTDFRLPPSSQLEYSSSWLVPAKTGISYGTVCIANSVFMKMHLLRQLARINGATTLIPVFSGVENNVWKLQFTRWDQHDVRKNNLCEWKREDIREGFAEFKWQHREGWSYEHESNERSTNGYYNVSCLTQNHLEIPTLNRSRTLEIRLKGEVKLEMSFKSSTQVWSAKCSAKWDAVLAITSESGGLKVKESGRSAPVFDKTEVDGQFNAMAAEYTDPRVLLKANLPSRIDLTEVLGELRAFEGCWQYCYPATYGYSLANPGFNRRGDILFEVRPIGLQAPPRSRSTSRQPGTRAFRSSSTMRGSPRSPSVRMGFAASMSTNALALESDHAQSNGYTNGESRAKTFFEQSSNGMSSTSFSDAGGDEDRGLVTHEHVYEKVEVYVDDGDRVEGTGSSMPLLPVRA